MDPMPDPAAHSDGACDMCDQTFGQPDEDRSDETLPAVLSPDEHCLHSSSGLPIGIRGGRNCHTSSQRRTTMQIVYLPLPRIVQKDHAPRSVSTSQRALPIEEENESFATVHIESPTAPSRQKAPTRAR